MAKKQTTLKSLLSQFMQKSLQSLISVVAEHSDNLVEWIKNMSGLRRKIRKLIVAFVLLTAGLVIFGMGAASYIASLYPHLGKGLSHILVGIVFIFVAIIYSKANE